MKKTCTFNKNNKRFGTCKYKTGVYVGELDNKTYDGKGKYSWKWSNQKKNGTKTNVCTGIFKNNKMEGPGKCMKQWKPSKQSKTYKKRWFSGMYKNDKLNGKCKIKYTSGKKFNGTCKNNEIYKGEYKYKNGNVCKGVWKNDKIDWLN